MTQPEPEPELVPTAGAQPGTFADQLARLRELIAAHETRIDAAQINAKTALSNCDDLQRRVGLLEDQP